MPVPFGGIRPSESHLTHEATAAAGGRLFLQLLRDARVGLEELGRTPIKADGLAFAELAFAVGLVDALQGANFYHAGEQSLMLVLRSWILGFESSQAGNWDIDTLFKGQTYRECISATTLSSFSTAAIFSADVGCGLPRPKKDIVTVGLGCLLLARQLGYFGSIGEVEPCWWAN